MSHVALGPMSLSCLWDTEHTPLQPYKLKVATVSQFSFYFSPYTLKHCCLPRYTTTAYVFLMTVPSSLLRYVWVFAVFLQFVKDHQCYLEKAPLRVSFSRKKICGLPLRLFVVFFSILCSAWNVDHISFKCEYWESNWTFYNKKDIHICVSFNPVISR